MSNMHWHGRLMDGIGSKTSKGSPSSGFSCTLRGLKALTASNIASGSNGWPHWMELACQNQNPLGQACGSLVGTRLHTSKVAYGKLWCHHTCIETVLLSHTPMLANAYSSWSEDKATEQKTAHALWCRSRHL